MFFSSHIVLANPFKTLLRSEEDFDILAFSPTLLKKFLFPTVGMLFSQEVKCWLLKKLSIHFYKEYIESFQVFFSIYRK